VEQNALKYLENDRFAALAGIKLVRAEPGFAVARMEITENHLNGVNRVQGGAIFTLADFAFAAASNSGGIVTLGINVNISYFKSPKGKVITAEAKEISSGRKICGFNVDIFDEDKVLVARVSALGYKLGSEL
jgi:acyl-CoA thioesterase